MQRRAVGSLDSSDASSAAAAARSLPRDTRARQRRNACVARRERAASLAPFCAGALASAAAAAKPHSTHRYKTKRQAGQLNVRGGPARPNVGNF
jgi:hypothetical protein